MAASVKPRKREYDAMVKADLLLLNSTNIVAQVPLFRWVSAEMKNKNDEMWHIQGTAVF